MSELFESEYRRLRESWAHMSLDEFALIELTGDDRVEWLQGQATNDVRLLAQAGERTSFCFCEPTGGLIAVIDAWSLGNKILMTTAKSCVTAVLDRIEKMTVLEDVEARELPYHGISVQGPTAEERSMITVGNALVTDDGISLRSQRTPYGGWDFWSPDGSKNQERPLFPEVVEAARLEAGIPKWNIDMGVKTLVPELGADFEARHISYNKGCYTGQEVLMRIHARGHTNRTWVGLTGTGALNVGDEVIFEGGKVGTVTSAAHSPTFGHLAAASLRNEAAVEGNTVLVNGTEAVVRQMPILRSL